MLISRACLLDCMPACGLVLNVWKWCMLFGVGIACGAQVSPESLTRFVYCFVCCCRWWQDGCVGTARCNQDNMLHHQKYHSLWMNQGNLHCHQMLNCNLLQAVLYLVLCCLLVFCGLAPGACEGWLVLCVLLLLQCRHVLSKMPGLASRDE